MSMLKGLIVVTALAASTAAFAAPARISDTQYLELARCRALMASTELGGGDTAAADAALKAQRFSRDTYIYDRAEQLGDDTTRAVKHADTDHRAKLIAERDNVCRPLIGGATTTAGMPAAKPQALN